MKPFIVQIRDAEGQAEFDDFIMAPAGMDPEKAIALVDAAIIKVKTAHPEDFIWDDLMKELTVHGFEEPMRVAATEYW